MPEVTDDELFRHSSQFRVWSFTKDQLETRKRQIHEKGLKKTEALLESKNLSGKVDLLSFEDETNLIKWYASKVKNITVPFQMPSQVQATAVSYFRKFYLVHSVMDYHPKNILYTCVFLATKAENHFISIEKFCKGLPKTEPATILGLEFLVLQSLSFTLFVHSGLKPLHGFFLDMQSALPSKTEDQLGPLYDKSRQILIGGLITDAPFLFAPPHIALAAMLSGDEATTMEYLNKRFGGGDGSKDSRPGVALNDLVSVIRDCQSLLLQSDLPSSEQSRAIDKRLHLSTNPDKLLTKRPADSEGGPSATKRLRSELADDSRDSLESSIEPNIDNVEPLTDTVDE